MKTEHCKKILELIDMLNLPESDILDDVLAIVKSEIKLNSGTEELRLEKSGSGKVDYVNRVKKFIEQLDDEKKAKNKLKDGYWVDDFLKHYARCGVIYKAASMAKVPAQYVIDRKNSDRKFKVLFEQAREEFNDRVEYAAIVRAIDGIEVKKFYKDQPLMDPVTGKQYTERQYSDHLLGRLLESKKRQEYGKQEKHEHSFSGELRVAGMSPEQARSEIVNRIQKLVDN